MKVTKKKGKTNARVQAARVIVGGRRDGDDIVYSVRDQDTGREWKWKEADQPGLGDFLWYWSESWHPLAFHGRKFKRPGRGKGRLRKIIESALRAKRPPKSPREAWEAFAQKPPRGWEFYPTHAMGPDGSVNYERFETVFGEEKKGRKVTD